MARSYGNGSTKERSPGVWRLRYWRDGRQREETFRGSKTAAAKRLRNVQSDAPVLAEIEAEREAAPRTYGDLLDAWLAALPAQGVTPKYVSESERRVECPGGIRERLGAIQLDKLTAAEAGMAGRSQRNDVVEGVDSHLRPRRNVRQLHGGLPAGRKSAPMARLYEHPPLNRHRNRRASIWH